MNKLKINKETLLRIDQADDVKGGCDTYMTRCDCKYTERYVCQEPLKTYGCKLAVPELC